MQQLIQLIRDKALSFGDVKLASGSQSNYYIDLSKVTLTTKGLPLVVNEFWGKLDGATAIGGPILGAVPIVSGILAHAYNLKGFFVRKEPKTYGKNDIIEGDLCKDDKVILIEDVTTTGGSLLKAVLEVEKIGCEILKLITVIDRKAGAVEMFRKLRGYELISLLSVDEVLKSSDS